MKFKLSIFFVLLILSFNIFAGTGKTFHWLVSLDTTKTNYRIDYTKWVPQAGNFNNHVIVYNHGLQSHRAWENETFEKLSDLGFVVLAFDRIGSGTSEGELAKKSNKRLKGHIKNWQSFVETLDKFVGVVKNEYPTSSLHLWANSYGAKIVTAYLLQKKDESIISTVFTTPGLYRNTVSMPLPQEYNVLVLDRLPLFKISDEKYFPSTITSIDGDNGAHWFTSMDSYFEYIKTDEQSLRKMTKGFLEQTQAMDKFISKTDVKTNNLLNGQKRFYVMVNGDEMMDNQKVLSHIERNPQGADYKLYEGGADHKHFLAFTEDSEIVLNDIVEYLLRD